MIHFRQKSLIDLRKLVSESSSISFPLDTIPKRFVKIFPDLTMLLNLINSSLEHGVFPQALKTALDHPYIKNYNLDCQDLGICRSISNLSFISKLLEAAVLRQLKDHLEDSKV